MGSGSAEAKTSSKATTLGEWRRSAGQESATVRNVKDEMRANLLRKLEAREPLFPGVHGYEETVLPQIANAILARHNFILLGLRGQAKSRILRGLMDFLDAEIPYVAGCEIHDNPLRRRSAARAANCIAEQGDATPIAWLPRDARYVEKLATPDVTIADIIGDVDPIKAARGGRASCRRTDHSLWPAAARQSRHFRHQRTCRTSPEKSRSGLFNIMQEGDVQIKGYPVRLPLDVLLVFTANPEDYTARGKIITPLKDRIGSEIRTHYPATVEEGMSITAQEAWTERAMAAAASTFPIICGKSWSRWRFWRAKISASTSRSGVSQRLPIALLESVVSSAEQRAVRNHEATSLRAIADVYAAIPAMTGKLELEYEGELRGAENIARELIRARGGQSFHQVFGGRELAARGAMVRDWAAN